MIENEVIEEKTEKASTYLIPIPIFSSMEWVMNPNFMESREDGMLGGPQNTAQRVCILNSGREAHKGQI